MVRILRLLLAGATACIALLALPAAAGPDEAGRSAPATQHLQHLPLLLRSTGPTFPPQFRIAIDPAAHAAYGLAYPVTYRYIHPWLHDWSDGSPIRQHIDHIKGWSDLWYVGFGHLYLYRYVQERGLVAVSALAGP